MAIIKRGILGGFSNKIANVVGSSWKGIPVMRSLPLSVANPNTVAQRSQRSKFKRVSAAASALLSSVVKPLWDRTAQQMSGYNAFIQQNIGAFDDNDEFLAPLFQISKGRLGKTAILAATDNENGIVTVSWSPEPQGAFQESTDVAFVALVSRTGYVIGSLSGSAVRSDGSAQVNYTFPTDGKIFVYLAFMRADGSITGDSALKAASV